MFKNRSLQVKLVKDRKDLANDLTVAERIGPMTPEEVEQLSKQIMKQIAINVGAVIVVKIAVAVTLNIVAKKLGA